MSKKQLRELIERIEDEKQGLREKLLDREFKISDLGVNLGKEKEARAEVEEQLVDWRQAAQQMGAQSLEREEVVRYFLDRLKLTEQYELEVPEDDGLTPTPLDHSALLHDIRLAKARADVSAARKRLGLRGD